MINNPMVAGGAMTRGAAMKVTRFVDFCDTFHLPIVNLVDQPGVMTGPDAERDGTFVAAMQANDPSILKCGIETGAVAAINAHMGNVAFKTGRKVYWDAEKGEFKNDAEANALIKAHYQNGWKLPAV